MRLAVAVRVAVRVPSPTAAAVPKGPVAGHFILDFRLNYFSTIGSTIFQNS